jgi:hypothetical protein
MLLSALGNVRMVHCWLKDGHRNMVSNCQFLVIGLNSIVSQATNSPHGVVRDGVIEEFRGIKPRTVNSVIGLTASCSDRVRQLQPLAHIRYHK